MINNKKSQVESIIIFFGIVIAIFITSIIILRITNEIMTPFSNQLKNMSSEGVQAGTEVASVQNKFASIWDWVIILLFLFNIILLFISAFLVDIHPAFLIVYIIAIIFLVIFGNSFAYVIDSVWDKMGTSVETAQTPMQQFIINNFNIIMLGIIALSGIIMYAKFRMFSGQGTGGNY